VHAAITATEIAAIIVTRLIDLLFMKIHSSLVSSDATDNRRRCYQLDTENGSHLL